MFGYHVEAKLAKNKKSNKNEETTTPLIDINAADVKDISRTVVKHVTVGVVAIMTVATVLNTASQMVVNNTNPANKND